MEGVHLVDHPLVQHKLTLMREVDRSTKGFRQLLNEIGMLLCYEVTRDLPTEMTEIQTPLSKMQAPILAGKKLVLAPILRAGVGFLDGMLELVPSARVVVGHGQLPESELERVMLSFMNHEYDVLCATSIIENGLDIPLATSQHRCNEASASFEPTYPHVFSFVVSGPMPIPSATGVWLSMPTSAVSSAEKTLGCVRSTRPSATGFPFT